MRVEPVDRQRWRTSVELANAIFEYLRYGTTVGARAILGVKVRNLGIDRPFVEAYSPPQVDSSDAKWHILAVL